MNTRDRFWLGILGIILAAVLGLVTATVQASPAVGSIIYVDADATGENNGSSWANAFTGLQPGLAAAVSGDQIWVAEGTYPPTNRFDPLDPRSACFQMKNGVAIYGGFAGSETNLEQRDWVSHPTILSGDLGIVGDASDNSYHVFYHPDVIALDSSAILDGFTISDGNANGTTSPHYHGGGMYNYNSSPILTNVTFSGNSAATYGGGMHNRGSSPTLTNVTFSANSAGYGGGMVNGGSSPNLMEVTFYANSADFGGGMYNSSGNPTMTSVTFFANSALSGGGICNYNNSTPSLTNVIFVGNSAGTGGGMDSDYSSPILTNVTFLGNTATLEGGGMNNVSSDSTLTNSILWGNIPNQLSEVSGEGSVVTYSDIQGGFPGTGNIDLDPRFLRLPSPGGDGVWGTPDDDYGDLRLFLSPAIDAGNNAAVPPGILTDLLGQPRFVDVLAILDTGLGTPPIVDMGAYEAQYGYVFLPFVLMMK